MTPEELAKHSKLIDRSVSWIEERTNDIWYRYEEIGDCYTDECEGERDQLRRDMDHYLRRLQGEDKMIDKYEEILHNTTGIK